ncbi:MAG: sugar transferase [Solirubrobacterales bacterium]|nr:sugar transferase [Solirubrobacterales bacterium]
MLEANRGLDEAGESHPQVNAQEPGRARDMRSHRAPLLARLLRGHTFRAVTRVLSLLVCDYLAIAIALVSWLSLKAALKDSFHWEEVRGLVDSYLTFAFVVAVLLFARNDLYRERARRPGLPGIAKALFETAVIALIFALANGEKFSSYSVFYGTLAFAIITVTLFRAVHDRVTAKLASVAGVARKAIVVGTGAHAESVIEALTASTRWPLEVVGGVTAPEDLGAALDAGNIDEVVVAETDFPQERIVDLAEKCHRRGVEIHVAPTTMEILLQHAEFRPGMPLPLFTLQSPTFDGFDFVVKRLFDLVGSALLLFLLSPFLALCALAVRLSSPGPVFYRSVRPGIGEVPFDCLKFRTMFVNSDRRTAELEELNEASGALFKIKQDPRVTPLGRILRRFSIDELPQLWNVLTGEMSLVGPRPLPMRDFELLSERHRLRYEVLPGITGLWQVAGRADLDFDELVRLDFVYLERWSVGLDLLILLKTFPAVLARRGAY